MLKSTFLGMTPFGVNGLQRTPKAEKDESCDLSIFHKIALTKQ